MSRVTPIALYAALTLGSAFGAAEGRAPAPALPTATPASVGMFAERLARLGEHFRAEVDKHTAAGYVIIVARDGRLVYSTTIGLRDPEKQLPTTLDTRYRIASMTKPVTSVAVLMLHEEGRFQLDDPVARYLPEFADARVYTGVDPDGRLTTEPAIRPITIRHLLTHTAGLGYVPGYGATTPLAKAYGSLPFASPGTLAEKIHELAGPPLYYPRATAGVAATRTTCSGGWSRSSRACPSSVFCRRGSLIRCA
jgi:CubicO group peptidase (beta-lactamase class C family)